MKEIVVSSCFQDTGNEIKTGASVFVDGRQGVIEAVCYSGSDSARDFACYKTGGLLVLFEDKVLELIPFGHHHEVRHRRPTS